MSEVIVIIEGYARQTAAGGFVASPTTTVIKDSGKNILFDPAASPDLEIKLAEHGLQLSDIDLIFLSHYHPDHILNIRLFPHVDIYDGDMIYRGDEEIPYSGGFIPNTQVQVIPTPGHAHEHASLVADTKEGKVIIAADVFWWMDDMEQKTDRESLLNLEDPFLKDKDALLASRKKLLDIGGLIIPGHGKPFHFGVNEKLKIKN